MVDRALSWIDAHRSSRFFLVVHLFDPHMSYDAPPPFRGRFSAGYHSAFSLPVRRTQAIRHALASLSDQDRQFITAAYDEEVAFTDAQIGRLLENLASRDLFKSVLVVFTA